MAGFEGGDIEWASQDDCQWATRTRRTVNADNRVAARKLEREDRAQTF